MCAETNKDFQEGIVGKRTMYNSDKAIDRTQRVFQEKSLLLQDPTPHGNYAVVYNSVKSEEKAKKEGELVETKESKEAVMLELEQLSNYNAELHQSFDFVMKN